MGYRTITIETLSGKEALIVRDSDPNGQLSNLNLARWAFLNVQGANLVWIDGEEYDFIGFSTNKLDWII